MKKIFLVLSLIISCLFLYSCDDSEMNYNIQSDQDSIPKSVPTEQTDKLDSSDKVAPSDKVDSTDKVAPSDRVDSTDTLTMIDVNITVGNKVFKAKLYKNQTTQDLVELFPLTIDMSDLNGNEKYNYLSKTFKTASEQPGELHVGDIMLYGDNCLVVFYKTFSNSYQYTRLGYVEDATGFAQAVTDSTTKVVFKLEW